MLLHLIKCENEKPAHSFDSALGLMEDSRVRGGCSDGSLSRRLKRRTLHQIIPNLTVGV